MRNFLLCFCAAALCAACGSDRKQLRLALAAGGENRGQLERVLEHYGHDEADNLKLRAAEFLIRHMPLHKSYDEGIGRYYDAVDSLIPHVRTKESFKEGMAELYDRHKAGLRLTNDIQTVTADYLIRNIEQAFDLWQNGKWASHLDFDEFCEYVLPYKCIERQPMTDWRSELAGLCRGDIDRNEKECREYRNNARMAALEVNRALSGNYLRYTKQLDSYPIFRATTLRSLPYGTCMESCTCALLAMRSKGIPVAIDFTPQWANRKYGHYWMTVLDMRHRSEQFAPFDIESDAHLNRPFSKIYRMTYRPDPELAKRVLRKESIPASLQYIFFRDVSDEYMRTDDLDVPLFDGIDVGDNIYISTFNNQEWVAVACGERRNGPTAHFERLGRNVCYMPVQCDRNGLHAIGQPFYLDYRGEMTPLRLDTTGRRTIRLTRKYPVYEFVHKNREKITGGVIQVSDTPDFRHTTDVTEFPRDSLTLAGNHSVRTDRPYRYWRLCASDEGRCDMAELIFYDRAGRRLAAELIRCGREVHPQNKVNLATAINDDDPLTLFSARGIDDIWVGFDFGRPVDVANVVYFRRSDGNNLYPGYEYVLSYWNGNRWQEIDRQTSDARTYLDFDGVPAEALLLLQCTTTGTESRPFTYRDGEIAWY